MTNIKILLLKTDFYINRGVFIIRKSFIYNNLYYGILLIFNFFELLLESQSLRISIKKNIFKAIFGKLLILLYKLRFHNLFVVSNELISR